MNKSIAIRGMKMEKAEINEKDLADILLENVEKTVAELNLKAEEAKGIDPLFDWEIRSEATVENHVTSVKLTAIYMSGHGRESAYVENDIFTFEIAGKIIRKIEMNNYHLETLNDMSLNRVNVENLLNIINKFFLKNIPEMPVLDI